MKDIKILMPEYVKKFSCIGDKCEDTCCQDWKIAVDKKTYKNYKNINNDDDFSNLLKKNIIFNKEKTSTSDYSYIKLDENEMCPFLDDNNLCLIYQKLGQENMPYTCKIYPRYITNINNGSEYEGVLQLSCPEAARLALLNKDKMEFTYDKIPNNDYLKYTKRMNLVDEYSYNLFWNMRIASITILQDRRFDIISRLVLLAMMYKKIVEKPDKEDFEILNDIIESHLNGINLLKDTNIIANLEADRKVQTSIYKSLSSNIQNLSKKIKPYFDDVKDMFYIKEDDVLNTNVTIEFVNGETKINYKTYIDAELVEKFDNLSKNKLSEIIDKYSYIFENYLVNIFFKLHMPIKFEKGQNQYSNLIKRTFDSVLYMAFCFSMIKILIASQIYKGVDVDENLIVDVIYSFERQFTHKSDFYEKSLDRIKKRELDSVGGIYTLIFN